MPPIDTPGLLSIATQRAQRRASRRAAWRRLAAVGIGLLPLVAACSDDDSVGTPILDLQDGETAAGTCLQVPEDLPPEVEKLPVVDCAEPHTHEIYAVVDYTEEDVFPGIAALDAFAEVECLAAFEPYVGIESFDSSLVFTWLVPTLGSWNDQDDRQVICVLADFQGAPLTGSQKDARI